MEVYTVTNASAMFSISAILFCLKRTPRVFALLFSTITILLSIFLLVGCYNNANLSIYLVDYKFEKNSPFYPLIQKSFTATQPNNQSLQGMESVSIKSGYMGVCLSNLPQINGSICYPRKDLINTTYYDDLSIELFNVQSPKNNTTASANSRNVPIKLNILQLAELTSTEIVHPYLLMATIILSVIMFLLILYVTVPKSPKKYIMNRFLLIWTSSLTLLWGFGTMWTHVAMNASSELVPRASLGIISAKKGKKAETMSWFVFAFLLLDSLILWFLYFRDRKKLSDEIDKLNSSNRFVSDS